jgi:RecB family exonuclease
MPNPTPARLSPTALRRYQTCPQQFLWADVERRPREFDSSPLLAVGNAVHHALERFFGLPEADRSLEVLHRALRAVWPAHRDAAGFQSRDEEAQWGRHALTLLASFASTFGMGGTPLERERWLRGKLKTGLVVQTKIDRIDPCPSSNAAVEVIDYKTGRCRITVDDLREEPAVWVSLLLARTTLKKRVSAVRYLYLGEATELKWQPNDLELKAAERKLEELATEIQADTTHAATPGDHCRFCPFALVCPDRSRVKLNQLVVTSEVPF